MDSKAAKIIWDRLYHCKQKRMAIAAKVEERNYWLLPNLRYDYKIDKELSISRCEAGIYLAWRS